MKSIYCVLSQSCSRDSRYGCCFKEPTNNLNVDNSHTRSTRQHRRSLQSLQLQDGQSRLVSPLKLTFDLLSHHHHHHHHHLIFFIWLKTISICISVTHSAKCKPAALSPTGGDLLSWSLEFGIFALAIFFLLWKPELTIFGWESDAGEHSILFYSGHRCQISTRCSCDSAFTRMGWTVGQSRNIKHSMCLYNSS